MKWLDISFSAASREWCAARKAEGWEGVCQDLWTGAVIPAPAYENLRNARKEGMRTAGYVVVNMRSGASAVNQGWSAAGAEWEYLEWVAVDVELTTTPAIIQEAIERLGTLGKKAIIYSAKWAWDRYALGNAFRLMPLWFAQYDNVDQMSYPTFGGWTEAVGKQYSGTVLIDGVDVDLNVFEEDVMGEVTREEFDKLANDLKTFREDVNAFNEKAGARLDELTVNWQRLQAGVLPAAKAPIP